MWDGEGTTTAGTTHRNTSILTIALLTEFEVGDIWQTGAVAGRRCLTAVC